ncbi:MAG TPA: hypothetical protein VF585_12165 [Chthoniobacterales bacterium]|jgi:hypothetical protein
MLQRLQMGAGVEGSVSSQGVQALDRVGDLRLAKPGVLEAFDVAKEAAVEDVGGEVGLKGGVADEENDGVEVSVV